MREENKRDVGRAVSTMVTDRRSYASREVLVGQLAARGLVWPDGNSRLFYSTALRLRRGVEGVQRCRSRVRTMRDLLTAVKSKSGFVRK